MAKAADRNRWNHTASILAYIQNWSGYSERVVQPAQLHPGVERLELEDEGSIDDLRVLLPEGHPERQRPQP